MKFIALAGRGQQIVDMRPLLGDDLKFVFYGPETVRDIDGNPLPTERRGAAVKVTNEQSEELLTSPWGMFVEVAEPVADAPATESPPARRRTGVTEDTGNANTGS